MSEAGPEVKFIIKDVESPVIPEDYNRCCLQELQGSAKSLVGSMADRQESERGVMEQGAIVAKAHIVQSGDIVVSISGDNSSSRSYEISTQGDDGGLRIATDDGAWAGIDMSDIGSASRIVDAHRVVLSLLYAE